MEIPKTMMALYHERPILFMRPLPMVMRLSWTSTHRHLTRQAKDAGIQFTPYVSTDVTARAAGSLNLTYEGIRVEAFVGLFADGEKEMDDGKHSYAASEFLRCRPVRLENLPDNKVFTFICSPKAFIFRIHTPRSYA